MLPSFNLWGSTVYLYPLMMGLAWGLAYAIAHKLAPKSLKNLNLILLGIFISAWAGAKVFFLITSAQIDRHEFLASSKFWIGGGFVFYGGLIFGLIFITSYAKLKKISLNEFSFFIVPLGVGHAVGRVGCFFAGCCHGIIVELETVDFHTPVQLFESFLILTITYISYKRLKKSQEVIMHYLVSYAVIRFFLEFLRADQIRGLHLGLSSSQIISIGLICFISLVKLGKHSR